MSPLLLFQKSPAANNIFWELLKKKYGCFTPSSSLHSYHPEIGIKHLELLKADVKVFFSNNDSYLVLNKGLGLD